MGIRPGQQSGGDEGATALRFAALIAANVALALGPWLVRLSDTGPVASGFWRVALALPLLLLLASREPVPPWRMGRAAALAVGLAGLCFALDIASWHLGIERTRLGNAALFGNAGSIVLMAIGLVAARRAPRPAEMIAVLAAIAGAALLMGASLEISPTSFHGDLLSLLAGLLYAGYILAISPARARLGSWSVLAGSSLASAPVLLVVALVLGESILAQDWTPLLALAFGSQILGQGLLIYALRYFSPLVIGLALLTQPAVAALSGWMAFGEILSLREIFGMILVASALAIVRASSPK